MQTGSNDSMEHLTTKYLKKQEKVDIWSSRLTKCSTALAVVSGLGITCAVFPFVVGAPDFSRPPPPHFPHHGPDG